MFYGIIIRIKINPLKKRYLIDQFYIFAPMKLVSILLIGYIFLLCGTPCKDECSINETICISAKQSSQSFPCDNEQQKCHSCSPFCFCNCCHVNTITSVLVGYQLVQTVYQEYNIIFIEKKIDLFHSVIWHPPKALA